MVFGFYHFVHMPITFIIQVEVYKNPATDEGKKSKKGRLTLERDDHGHLVTVQEGKGDPDKVGQMLDSFYSNNLIVYFLTDICGFLHRIPAHFSFTLVPNAH